MSLDFSEYFAEYEALVAEVDAVFARIAQQSGELVTCKKGCSDCCNAVFDLSLIEALYLNHHFNALFQKGAQREVIEERANRADREHYKHKRKAHKEFEKGTDSTKILEEMAKLRVRCPMLDDEDHCIVYAQRPITCRLYGVPQEIGGQGLVCHLSGFAPGAPYPTVKVEKIQDRLMAISQKLVAALKTKHPLMGEMLVPLSMAVLTVYDDDYLGLIAQDEKKSGEGCDCASSGCSSGDCASGGCGTSQGASGGCGGEVSTFEFGVKPKETK